jgi:2-polyprenyl-3-methyl-5-hydroxy-6-metoxy-1,4-benzoquinol methylase
MNYLGRSNRFDQWVGARQAVKVIELGVGESILDVGCGDGRFTSMYLDGFIQVAGLDPEQKYLKIAIEANNGIAYHLGFGETFSLDKKFDTIALTQLLEHVDDPIAVLKNCKEHLAEEGRIIVQVPNSNSIARRLGVLMGLIPSTNHISERERNVCGHQRIYTLAVLEADCKRAGLKVIKKGGVLFKPLPNKMLQEICEEQGRKWRNRFIDALVEFGEDRPEDCANLFVVCESE